MRPITPEDIAQAIMRWTRRYRHDAPPHEVVEDYFRDVMRIKNPSYHLMRQVRSGIARFASKKSQEAKRAQKKREAGRKRVARQYKLSFDDERGS